MQTSKITQRRPQTGILNGNVLCCAISASVLRFEARKRKQRQRQRPSRGGLILSPGLLPMTDCQPVSNHTLVRASIQSVFALNSSVSLKQHSPLIFHECKACLSLSLSLFLFSISSLLECQIESQKSQWVTIEKWQ